MRCLIAPSTGTVTDRAYMRELWAAVDVLLGYPRTHAADEPGVSIARGRAAPRTDTAFAGYRHSSGSLALVIDDPPPGLLGRRITRGATTRTLGEWVDWLVANRGWTITRALPGADGEWVRVAHRDGAAGSATGRPIPEGEE